METGIITFIVEAVAIRRMALIVDKTIFICTSQGVSTFKNE